MTGSWPSCQVRSCVDTKCGGVIASTVLAGWLKKYWGSFYVKEMSVSVASAVAFQHVTGMVIYQLNIAIKLCS